MAFAPTTRKTNPNANVPFLFNAMIRTFFILVILGRTNSLQLSPRQNNYNEGIVTPKTCTVLSPQQIDASTPRDCWQQREVEKLRTPAGRAVDDRPGLDGAETQFRIWKASTPIEREMARLSRCVEGVVLQHMKTGLVCGALNGTVLQTACVTPVPCNQHNPMYRTYDGSCNNVKHPYWGKANTAFDRILKPSYGDRVRMPRTKKDGSKLPNPRAVSATLIGDVSFPIRKTTLLMSFGQFLIHDLSFIPEEDVKSKCCDKGLQGANLPECQESMPYSVAPNDVFAIKCKKNCIDFTRTLPALKTNCRLGSRQQMNAFTAYVDASMVYGNSKQRAMQIRTGMNGALKTVSCHQRPFPPFTAPDDTCAKPTLGFMGGEHRTNANPLLATLQVLFMREHNLIASKLHRLNSIWADETVYQEARRIVGAELQNIVYGEWLPQIIGEEEMKKFDLCTKKDGYYDGYDPNMPAGIYSSFASAAFRFGHSMIASTVNLYNEKMEQSGSYQLSTTFNRSVLLVDKPTSFGMMTRGLIKQQCQRMDQYVTKEVTEHLYADGEPCGLDLVAIDIQRGRDHGLPSYNDFREAVGGPTKRIRSLEEYREVFPNTFDMAQVLKLYGSFDEADLFPLGIAEQPTVGGLVGHTFAHIIGRQFHKLKKGDRFFFENSPKESPHAFNPSQLQAIRQWGTMARLLCSNGDLAHIQKNPFGRDPEWIGLQNMVPCSELPPVNLQAWAVQTGRKNA